MHGSEDRKKHVVILFEDLNMPTKDRFGAQPPILILRQWMDYKSWYDIETRESKQLVDIYFVAALHQHDRLVLS